MITARIRIEGDTLEKVSEIRESGRRADAAMKKSLDRITKGVQAPLKRDLLALTPGNVFRPIDWTSDKQRRAYFATDGFGAGIPYRRKTGASSLMGRWRVSKFVSRRGNLITATNDSPVYKFVAEDPDNVNAWQRFHRNTGWPSALKQAEVFAVYQDIAETQIGDDWFLYWDNWFEGI